MAKQPTAKSGTSRIRFIMIDAEIPDGDLSQITTAIHNALKPTTTIIQRLAPQNSSPAQELEFETGEDEGGEFEVIEPRVAVKAPRVSKPRKPTTPDVLDLDMTSDLSLEAYAHEHSPSGEPERYLVIAAWFKEHRDTPNVTTSHIYTGYRSVGWSVAIEDFGWPLRQLKKDKYMSSSTRGEYAINHLGIARVNKLGKGE